MGFAYAVAFKGKKKNFKIKSGVKKQIKLLMNTNANQTCEMALLIILCGRQMKSGEL